MAGASSCVDAAARRRDDEDDGKKKWIHSARIGAVAEEMGREKKVEGGRMGKWKRRTDGRGRRPRSDRRIEGRKEGRKEGRGRKNTIDV